MEFLHDFLMSISISLLIFLLLSVLFSADDRRRVAQETVHITVNNEEKEIEADDYVREGCKVVEISRRSASREENRSEEAQADEIDPSELVDLVESVHSEDSSNGMVGVVFADEVNELQGVDSIEIELEKGKEEQSIHDINEVQLKVDSSAVGPPLRDYEVNELEGVHNREFVLEKEMKEQNIYEINEFEMKVDSFVETSREVEIAIDKATLDIAQEKSKESIATVSNFEHLSEMLVFDDNLVEEDKSSEVLEEVHSQILMVEKVKEESCSVEEKSCIHEVTGVEDSSAVVPEPELLEKGNYLLKDEVDFQEKETKIVEGAEIKRETCDSVVENEFPPEVVAQTLGPFTEDMLENEIGRDEESCVDLRGGTLLDDEDEWEGIERSEVEKLFGIANAYVGSEIGIDALSKLSSDVQMQLYGLYKVATQGPCYEPQPIAFKVSARAKWHSWQRLGKMDPEVAMEQYMTILSQNVPGWMGDKYGESIKPLERHSASSSELCSGTKRISQVRLRFPLTSTSSILWISFILFAGSCFN